ncbi:MAG: NF038104 family lipoprotein [Gammaproteobacteria bacterium]
MRIPMLAIVVAALMLSGCVSTVLGTAADIAIGVVKVPVKVGGAVVDAVTDDDEDDEDD